jgi:hypothetical protein
MATKGAAGRLELDVCVTRYALPAGEAKAVTAGNNNIFLLVVTYGAFGV